MAKKNEISVEEKLRSLFDLQIIDSRIDEIRNVHLEASILSQANVVSTWGNENGFVLTNNIA